MSLWVWIGLSVVVPEGGVGGDWQLVKLWRRPSSSGVEQSYAWQTACVVVHETVTEQGSPRSRFWKSPNGCLSTSSHLARLGFWDRQSTTNREDVACPYS